MEVYSGGLLCARGMSTGDMDVVVYVLGGTITGGISIGSVRIVSVCISHACTADVCTGGMCNNGMYTGDVCDGGAGILCMYVCRYDQYSSHSAPDTH